MLNFMRKKTKGLTLHAISKGNLIPLEQINDPVFSQKLMGEGIAIDVKDNQIFSPVDGVITMIAQTKHAFGIKTSSGVEIIVHVGLETVALKGEGFYPKVKEGATVKQGEVILTIDTQFIKKQNVELVTPIIVSDSQGFTVHPVTSSTEVSPANPVLLLK